MLEHLERLDAVEASLQRLGVDEPLIEEEDEEVDVGESSTSRERTLPLMQTEEGVDLSASAQFLPPESPDGVTSLPDDERLADSITEEDLAAMSKSMSHVESPPAQHMRWNSHAARSRQQLDNALEWMTEAEQRKRTVIVEVSAQLQLYQIDIEYPIQRLETVQAKPLLSCW